MILLPKVVSNYHLQCVESLLFATVLDISITKVLIRQVLKHITANTWVEQGQIEQGSQYISAASLQRQFWKIVHLIYEGNLALIESSWGGLIVYYILCKKKKSYMLWLMQHDRIIVDTYCPKKTNKQKKPAMAQTPWKYLFSLTEFSGALK